MQPHRQKSQKNRFRIIAGQWRGRILPFPDGEGLRPTGDRIRETLFNWLQFDINGADCLDAFSGSGALALEALSRGAASVTCLDSNAQAIQQLQRNGAQLKTRGLHIQQADSLGWLQHNTRQQQFDVAFLDPPFAMEVLESCCQLLDQQHWLKDGARVYLESPSPLENLSLPAGWTLDRSRKAGNVYYGLCTKPGSQGQG